MDNVYGSNTIVTTPIPITIVQPQSFFQRTLANLRRVDVIVVYTIVIVVWLLFFLSYIPGIYSAWYASLKQPTLNVWIPRVAWIIASILSYVGFYILMRNATPNEVDKYLAVTMLYVVGSFIMLGWSVALYQAQNIALATWISGILFVYQAALFLLIWYLNPIAAIFTLPLLALYLYLLYTMVQLAALNNQIL